MLVRTGAGAACLYRSTGQLGQIDWTRVDREALLPALAVDHEEGGT
jgi:hypothetical protein